MVAICLIATIGTACHDVSAAGPLTPGRTGESNNNHSGVAGPVPVGHKAAFTRFDMCTKAAPATITSLTFTSPGAHIVEARIYRRGPRDTGATGVPTLAPGGTTAIGTTIDLRCQPGGGDKSQELDVLLERTAPNEVTGEVEIGYSSNSKPYTLTYPVTIILRNP